MSFFVLSFGFFGVLLLDYYPSSVQVQAIYLDAMVARTCRFAPQLRVAFVGTMEMKLPLRSMRTAWMGIF